MKLINAIIFEYQEYNFNSVKVEYRTDTPWEKDTLTGWCWVEKVGNRFEITHSDGDNYSLDDEILKYEFDFENNVLTIWYECKWISHEEKKSRISDEFDTDDLIELNKEQGLQ